MLKLTSTILTSASRPIVHVNEYEQMDPYCKCYRTIIKNQGIIEGMV